MFTIRAVFPDGSEETRTSDAKQTKLIRSLFNNFCSPEEQESIQAGEKYLLDRGAYIEWTQDCGEDLGKDIQYLTQVALTSPQSWRPKKFSVDTMGIALHKMQALEASSDLRTIWSRGDWTQLTFQYSK